MIKPLRVGFILANNFTLSALANFVDTLRLASDDGDLSRQINCRWFYMSGTGLPVTSSCGLSVAPTAGLISPSELDYIVVVGGLLHRGSQIDEPTQKYLLKAGAGSTPLVGVCTGSFILCRLGLLLQRKCCISWYHYRDFMEEFDDQIPIADQLYVIDGDRITCSGGLGGAYLAAHLIERRLGAASAQKALHILLIDRGKPGETAQPAPPVQAISDDERISKSLVIMEQNVSHPIRIAQIAQRMEVSHRQLERLFKLKLGTPPQTIYLKMRLRHARWLLRTEQTLSAIAVDTGFVDATHLAKTFKAAYGVSPSEARRQMLLDDLVTRPAGADCASRRAFDVEVDPGDLVARSQ